jgi:hypothetical protein
VNAPEASDAASFPDCLRSGYFYDASAFFVCTPGEEVDRMRRRDALSDARFDAKKEYGASQQTPFTRASFRDFSTRRKYVTLIPRFAYEVIPNERKKESDRD